MALSLASQWKLVAAGMMAHADQVMTGEECERLMLLVETDVDGDEYADWLSVVSDRERLTALFQTLDPPPQDSQRDVLEEAWLMAVVDGHRHDAEVQMLATIAGRLGVETVQLEFWREAWTKAQSDRAETTIRTLSTLIGDADAALLQTVLFELPTTTEHRDALAAIAKVPQSRDDVVRRLAALPKALRRDVVTRLAAALQGATDTAAALAGLRTVALAAGLSEAEIGS